MLQLSDEIGNAPQPERHRLYHCSRGPDKNPVCAANDRRGSYLRVPDPKNAAVQYVGPGANAWPENVCGENPRKYGTEEDVCAPRKNRPCIPKKGVLTARKWSFLSVRSSTLSWLMM